VTAEELIDSLWGDAPPRTAAKSLQTHVLRLRNALEPERRGSPRLLVTEGPGYRLAVADEAVDARRFARLVEVGRRAYAEGKADVAARTLREGLALWRGPAYAGFEATTFGGGEARRLEELRMVALEDRIAADLDLGRALATVPELEALVHEQPLRERLWHLLVLGLYRSGRQADALAAYARARQTLVEELGVEPGEELRRLHAGVLAQDTALLARVSAAALPAALVPPPGPFVGRDHEFAVLRDAWARTTAGQPGTIVVRGPWGAGTRRIAAELAVEVAERGGVVEHQADGTVPVERAVVPTLTVVAGPVTDPSGGGQGSGPRLTVVLGTPATPVPDWAEALDLRPLPPGDVRTILLTYLDEPTVDDVLPQVLREAGGIPGRVHNAAVGLCRRRAAVRVSDAADRTSETHDAFAAAREDLRERVADFRDVVERESLPGAEACPWKGLAAYDLADAPWFAGRERLVAELLARLAPARLLAVVGASGSGKSSLVHAGLLASLQAGALPGSEGWARVVVRPGPRPMRELVRAALHGAEPGPDRVADLLERMVYGGKQAGRVVLVVDQLEETWTVCADAAEWAAFLDAIADLAESDTSCAVVLVVRADYVASLADHPAISRALADATVLVGSPSAAEVRRAVEHPAERAGLVLDVGLADALVADAADEPGSLPALSTALTELWAHRVGRRLTLAAYVGAGGIRGVVARIAERAYSALDPDDKAAARVLLMRLAGPGERDAVTRRRVPLAELNALPDPRVRAVVAPLTDARLLTVGEGHVEVAHEALFREWPRLRAWLDEDAAGRAVQRRLAVAASEWETSGREPTELWRGARLSAGVDFAAAHPEEVTDVESAFLEAGQAQLDTERRAAEARAAAASRQNRRLRWLSGGLVLVLLSALAAGAVAVQSRARAEQQRLTADAQRLAATALNEDYPDQALLAAVEAVRMQSSPETLGALVTLLARTPRMLAQVRTTGHFLRLDCTPDAQTCFAGLSIGEVWRIDGRTGVHTVMSLSPAHWAGEVDVSPDGRFVAIGLEEDTWRIDVYRLANSRRVFALDMTGERRRPAMAWSPDSRSLFVPRERGLVAVDARAWAVSRLISWQRPTPASIFASAVTLDADRVLVAFEAEPRARLVDLRTSRVTRPVTAGPLLALSPGRRLLASAGEEDIRLIDVATWRDRGRLRVDGFVENIEFSPDGGTLAAGFTQSSVQLWDVDSGASQGELTGHNGAVLDLDFAADGRTLWTSGGEGLAVAWDLTGRRGMATQENLGVGTNTGEAAADGRTAVLLDMGAPPRALLWDLARAAADRSRGAARCRRTHRDHARRGRRHRRRANRRRGHGHLPQPVRRQARGAAHP
jgi:DNA-binding SARP family transcriptional activator